MADSTPFDDLVAVMAKLRGPGGCPWDREQTLASLRTYLVEETYELLEAIDRGEPGPLREELGDLLLEVVFLARVCEEQGLFDIHDVAAAIRDKLVRRHPHVFQESPAATPAEALGRWEEIKNQEKKERDPNASLLEGIPAHQPALMRAHRLSSKASLAGFDWKAMEDLYGKLLEELTEFRQAASSGDRQAMEEELGDLLFIAANVGRFAGIDPEIALQAANRKFISRFQHIESALRAQGIAPKQATLDQMEALWEEAKALERKKPGGPPG
jgi:tetrapyrrole methylase family protein / MazG family protein